MASPEGRTEAAIAATMPPTATSWATVMALTIATEVEDPWLITHTPSTPRSMAPPVVSGSRAAAYGIRCGRSAPAASAASGRLKISPRLVMRKRSVPSKVLRATLPVNPSVTITSA